KTVTLAARARLENFADVEPSEANRQAPVRRQTRATILRRGAPKVHGVRAHGVVSLRVAQRGLDAGNESRPIAPQVGFVGLGERVGDVALRDEQRTLRQRGCARRTHEEQYDSFHSRHSSLVSPFASMRAVFVKGVTNPSTLGQIVTFLS